MDPHPSEKTSALLSSFKSAPLLVDSLPEAAAFPTNFLTIPDTPPDLNFSQKLGHLYEDALAQLFQASPRYDLLEQSLQIQKDKHTTVGELDFLIRDLTSGQLIHLELATKFYLALETENGLTLPGPDARDNYFKKIARLRDHQLQLPKKHHAHLPESYRDEAITTQHLIFGCLFDHIDSPRPTSPEFINPACRRGKWLHLDKIEHYFPKSTSFEIIPKPLWPVPLASLEKIELARWNSTSEIERCLMVRTPNSKTPIFIAPSGYPNL